MKKGFKNFLKLLALLVSVNGFQSVHAVPIDGEISISGGFVPFRVITSEVGEERVLSGLADATGIDFLNGLGAYGTPDGQFRVASATGDFAAAGIGYDDKGIINDFSFVVPFTPVEPLWFIGGFSFDLMTVTLIEQTSSTLILKGSGNINSDGNIYDMTGGSWILTANSFGTTFSWSSSTAASNVPEPATLLLLGVGLLGMGSLSRRKEFKL